MLLFDGRNQFYQLFSFGTCIATDHQFGINLVHILFNSAFREKKFLSNFAVAQMFDDQSGDFCFSAVQDFKDLRLRIAVRQADAVLFIS